ncbi:MAG: serine--tRNA ligase [Proteobacteria bacterium]|nr:serine--tRNA ligase [Pseudomonadota bacterium]
MHARKFVEEHPDLIRQALAARYHEFDLDSLLEQLTARKAIRAELEALQTERNTGSKQVGELFKAGKRDEGQELRVRLGELGKKVAELEGTVKEAEAAIDDALMSLPNLLADDVPMGKDDADNTLVKTVGEPRSFDFDVVDHHDLGVTLGILDFERGAKITGARFTVLRGVGARLNRALVQWMLDVAVEQHGYTEVLPPFIVNTDSLLGTGQLPKFGDDLFRLQNPDHYWLAPTAEVPVTNLHRDEILGAADLPLKYCAYTPCFRAEAGSYGRDVRGLIRQHQFEKVELVQIVPEDASEAAHEELTGHAEAIIEGLELPYRRVTLCSGDLSFSAWKCYDLEVWLPGQNAYREISSCSNFKDFQARRASIRYRPGAGAKPNFAHTLNGSGLAIGRTLLAILETYQQADGSVVVPEVLRPYMRGIEVIEPA